MASADRYFSQPVVAVDGVEAAPEAVVALVASVVEASAVADRAAVGRVNYLPIQVFKI